MRRYAIEARKRGSDETLKIEIDGNRDVAELFRAIVALGAPSSEDARLPSGEIGKTVDSLGFEEGTEMTMTDPSEGGAAFRAVVTNVTRTDAPKETALTRGVDSEARRERNAKDDSDANASLEKEDGKVDDAMPVAILAFMAFGGVAAGGEAETTPIRLSFDENERKAFSSYLEKIFGYGNAYAPGIAASATVLKESTEDLTAALDEWIRTGTESILDRRRREATEIEPKGGAYPFLVPVFLKRPVGSTKWNRDPRSVVLTREWFDENGLPDVEELGFGDVGIVTSRALAATGRVAASSNSIRLSSVDELEDVEKATIGAVRAARANGIVD